MSFHGWHRLNDGDEWQHVCEHADADICLQRLRYGWHAQRFVTRGLPPDAVFDAIDLYRRLVSSGFTFRRYGQTLLVRPPQNGELTAEHTTAIRAAKPVLMRLATEVEHVELSEVRQTMSP